MSWLQHLYETYEQAQEMDLTNDVALRPYYHMSKKADIIITLDENGNFLSSEYIAKTDKNKPRRKEVFIPATIDSANARTNTKVTPHPLSDEFKYIAGDYEDFNDDDKDKYFEAYRELLSNWVNLDPDQLLPASVLKYIDKKKLLNNLCNHPNSQVKDIFKDSKLVKPKYIVLWRIQSRNSGQLIESWQSSDNPLFSSWQAVCEALEGETALCYATGQIEKVATKHAKGFLTGSSGSKLISCNDDTNFTFCGRFTDKKNSDSYQAVNISELYSDKAHAALEWLLKRQGYNNNGLGIVAWAATDKAVIQPFINPTEAYANFSLDNLSVGDTDDDIGIHHNLGLHQGQIFRNYLYGYYKKLELEDIKKLSVIALTASTTGRAAVTYYRQTNPKDYYERLMDWHTYFSWKTLIQTASGIRSFVLSPSLFKLSEVLYGRKSTRKQESTETAIKQSRLLFQRLLPCIVDSQVFPLDIVNSCYQKACNSYHDRTGGDSISFSTKLTRWQEDITIFCAIYRGYLHRNQKRSVSVELDNNNTNRSYLFGRLLAVANRIEELALQLANEPRRPTNAFKYMQRFTQKPCQVWMMIRTEALPPYQKRLISRVPPLESAYMRLIQDIEALLENNADFSKDERLDPDFLLGYDLQSKWLLEHKLVKGKWELKEDKEVTADITKNDIDNAN